MRRPSTSVRSRALPAALVALAAVYLVQLASPLRLDTDSSSYLQIASSIADGNGTRPTGTPSFPVGYPLLVAGLDTVGLATPWAIVALNLAFLALATASLWVVLRRGLDLGEVATGTVCALTLLSSAIAKHAVMPMSEVVFYGLAAAALALLTISAADRCGPVLVGGIVLALAACFVRTAGIALAPAVVLAFRSSRSRILAAITVVAGAALALASTPRYLDELSGGWREGPLRSGAREGRDLLEMLGAAVGNIPESKIDTVSPFLVAIGAVALLAIVTVIVTRRRCLGPVDGWVIGSLVVLFAWPSDATRFVLPLFPFLLGYGAVLGRRWRPVAIAYATLFAALGLVAITLSTRLTLSGEQFPERYAGGILAPTYRVVWGMAEPGDLLHVYRPALEVLRRYDPDPPGGRSRGRAHAPYQTVARGVSPALSGDTPTR